MSQSLSQLYIHIIFHIKSSPYVKILNEDKNRIYAYISTIIKGSDCHSIIINGTEDHIHILCILPRNTSVSKLVQNIKGNSSRWIKTLSTHYLAFA